MKKLRNKVFIVIFSILTIFTFSILTFGTVKTYIDKKKAVEDILLKMPRNEMDRKPYMPKMDDPRRIYMDSIVYTIILDDNGNFSGIINHTYNDNIDEENIKKIANDIISNHNDDIYIGNLYSSRYAYLFSHNSLTIIDNIDTNNMLLNQLLSNIIIFIMCEVIIFIITYLITKWIITPVKKSFEKQKVFVADASHELKTPLAVMMASADAYMADKDDKWVVNMKNESERMIKLVTELLDLAKTEEEQDIKMTENNLSDIIESSTLTFESLFYENKLKLKYNIEPNIKLLCNESLITELISILIDNAIKHSKSKGHVNVNLYKKNKDVILEVINEGLPIKKEDEEKIFERFYKVDESRNRNSNNYGLGLAIAKNICIKHKANISANSNDGYTTFKVIWNQK